MVERNTIDPSPYEIMTRALCDNFPEQVDLAFLHAETKDNERSCLQAGAEFYLNGFTPKLGILCADASIFDEMIEKYEKGNPELAGRMKPHLTPKDDGSMVGYLGFKHWKESLVASGVNREDIVLIEPSYKVWLSTDGEARGLVEYCKQQRIERVCITAPPFQQTRAFISDISAIIQEGASGLRVYSRPGHHLDWNEKVTHSQGFEEGTRRDFIEGECKKIVKYQKSGSPPLSSFKEVLGYLNRRG